jgi:hypothetical protein
VFLEIRFGAHAPPYVFNLPILPGYTTIVNLFDYTAAVVTVTTVDKSIDVVQMEFKPLSELDEKVYKTCKLLI